LKTGAKVGKQTSSDQISSGIQSVWLFSLKGFGEKVNDIVAGDNFLSPYRHQP
jgi:hypothetical protein